MNHDITLDTKTIPGESLFAVTNGDTGVTLNVTLLQDGAPHDLTGKTIKAKFTASTGGEATQENAKELQGNTLRMELLPASFSPGAMLCEIQVWHTPEQAEAPEPAEGEEPPPAEPAAPEPVLESTALFLFTCYKAKVKKRFAISLDAKRSTSNREVEVVYGDNGNVLMITLTDDGVPVDMRGSFVMAVFSKPDGRTAEQDTKGNGVTIGGAKNNELEIELYLSSVSPGLVECEILVFSGEEEDTLITSARFNFACRRGITNQTTIAETVEWPVLVSLSKEAEERRDAYNNNEVVRQANEDDRVRRDRAFAVWEEYDPDKRYVPLNKVAHRGASYLCIEDAQGNAPPDAMYWLLIAAKGRDGDGSGDMLKVAYDINDSGIVDDAQRLGGKLPKAYALAAVRQEITLYAENWTEASPYAQTVSVPGLLEASNVIVAAAPEHFMEYGMAGIHAVAQHKNALMFVSNHPPQLDLHVNILIVG